MGAKRTIDTNVYVDKPPFDADREEWPSGEFLSLPVLASAALWRSVRKSWYPRRPRSSISLAATSRTACSPRMASPRIFMAGLRQA